MSINSQPGTFVKNSYFTDETQYLSINWVNLGSFTTGVTYALPDTLAFGMSSQGPETFNANSMEIPFETVNPYNADGTYRAIYNWDISKYQAIIRSMLTAYRESTIYVYAKAVKNNVEFIHWHVCYVSIADVDAVPIFTTEPSYTVTDTLTKNLTGNSTTVIRYVSAANVTFACEARKSSTLLNSSVKIGSKITNRSLSGTTASITQAISEIDGEVFNVTVMDSRGLRTMHSTPVVRYIKYFYPTCNLTVTNPSAAGGRTTLIADGLCFNGSFGYQSNTISVQYRYKLTTGSYSSWSSMTITRDGDNYTATASISGLNYQSKYSFQARITDKITSVSSIETIAKSQPVFDWGEDDFRFNVPVQIEGALMVGDTVTTPSVSTNDVTISNGSLTLNGFTLTDLSGLNVRVGQWTPSCNACTSPDIAHGYYIKVGAVVIINFYFQGTTNSKQDNLKIGNLPFTPDSINRWYAGGGVCQGHKGDTSDAFAGWNIETASNVIYGRTSHSGSSFSSSSLYIAVNSGVQLYASGTICYKATA